MAALRNLIIGVSPKNCPPSWLNVFERDLDYDLSLMRFHNVSQSFRRDFNRLVFLDTQLEFIYRKLSDDDRIELDRRYRAAGWKSLHYDFNGDLCLEY